MTYKPRRAAPRWTRADKALSVVFVVVFVVVFLATFAAWMRWG